VPASSSRCGTEKEESLKPPTTIALDLSKSVFEVAVERGGRICERRRLNRRDAEAILSARHRREIVPVPVKTVKQQTISSLHRIRSVLVQTLISCQEHLSDWLPVCGFHPGPEPMLAPTTRP